LGIVLKEKEVQQNDFKLSKFLVLVMAVASGITVANTAELVEFQCRQ
jgi:hypothetical protein